jgi:hypothetical protein
VPHRRGVLLPKPAGGEVGVSPEWEETLRAAYEAGAGRGDLDVTDDDLLDAARLATPVGEGILWHPATLDDIYAVPSRTLLLFDFYRLGIAARLNPWTWWRVAGKREMCHQYSSDWRARPLPPARCGYEPGGKLERYDIGHCSRCENLDRGQVEQPTGTVAGVKVGATRGHGQGSRQGQA